MYVFSVRREEMERKTNMRELGCEEVKKEVLFFMRLEEKRRRRRIV